MEEKDLGRVYPSMGKCWDVLAAPERQHGEQQPGFVTELIPFAPSVRRSLDAVQVWLGRIA
jgi:hypothetical protein